MRNRAFAARRRARAPPMKRPFWNKVPRGGTAVHAAGYIGLRRSHHKRRNAVLKLKIASIHSSKIQQRDTATAHDDTRTDTLGHCGRLHSIAKLVLRSGADLA